MLIPEQLSGDTFSVDCTSGHLLRTERSWGVATIVLRYVQEVSLAEWQHKALSYICFAPL